MAGTGAEKTTTLTYVGPQLGGVLFEVEPGVAAIAKRGEPIELPTALAKGFLQSADWKDPSAKETKAADKGKGEDAPPDDKGKDAKTDDAPAG